MYDRELVSEVLNQIKHSADLVLKRFEPIKAASDFTDNSLLPRYPHIEWKKVKGMRDIISHHYFDIDADANELIDFVKELKGEVEKWLGHEHPDFR